MITQLSKLRLKYRFQCKTENDIFFYLRELICLIISDYSNADRKMQRAKNGFG